MLVILCTSHVIHLLDDVCGGHPSIHPTIYAFVQHLILWFCASEKRNGRETGAKKEDTLSELGIYTSQSLSQQLLADGQTDRVKNNVTRISTSSLFDHVHVPVLHIHIIIIIIAVVISLRFLWTGFPFSNTVYFQELLQQKATNIQPPNSK